LRESNLSQCGIGDKGIRLIADVLVGNAIMDKLDIGYNALTAVGLDDITRILESTQLASINVGGNAGIFYNTASTRRFARILSTHEFLKELRLAHCQLGDAVLQINVVTGLFGNTILEILDIQDNGITSAGLDDIMRLLESTQLKTITLWGNRDIFNDIDATQRFVSTLQHKESSVQQLPGIRPNAFSGNIREETYASINNSLTRNRQLNLLKLLLAPPEQQQQQPLRRRPRSTMMMLKISHQAITKFATVTNKAGVSAIFKLFQARPHSFWRKESNKQLLLLLRTTARSVI
jgi:Leucine Rich repeat